MDTLEKECSALGGLFQQIMNDMKASSPVWEDFLSKSTKLNTTLRATIVATGAFLEAFQKVADMATGTRGATREIGSALTRLCMRHRSIEARLKAFSSAIMDTMVTPLQEKMEDWRRAALHLDKEHAKEYKKARAEIKRASSDTIRLQKKAKKGKSDVKNRLDSAMQEVNDKYLLLEETEKNSVRMVMMEERSRFCQFIYCLKPVVDEEIQMLTEITHLQEIVDHLCKHSIDPATLPAASEQVILDVKRGDAPAYQTPPSSPSSLGSRKSSMCSISSINSSSSGSTHSPSHHYRNKAPSQHIPPGAVRLSSVSSQDSGFTSQDTLHLKPPATPPPDYVHKMSLQDGSSGSSTGTDSGGTTPSPSFPIPSSTSASTWSNWPDPPFVVKQTADMSSLERPHTISTAYERSHARPSLTCQTFEPPDPHAKDRPNHTAPPTPNPYAVPCVVPQAGGAAAKLQGALLRDPRVTSLSEYARPPAPGPKPRSRPVMTPMVPDFNRPNSDQSKKAHVVPRPVYVNMNELASMAVQKQREQQERRDSRVGGGATDCLHEEEEDDYEDEEDDESSDAKTPDANEGLSLGNEMEIGPDMRPSAGKMHQRSMSMPPQSANTKELAEAIRELEESTAALQMDYTGGHPNRLSLQCSSGYGTMSSTPACSENTIASDDLDHLTDELTACVSELPDPPAPVSAITVGMYCTLPRNGQVPHTFRIPYQPRRPASTAGLPGVTPGTATIRRGSLTSGKPPTPIRRTASIAGGMPVAPPVVPGSGAGTPTTPTPQTTPQGTPTHQSRPLVENRHSYTDMTRTQPEYATPVIYPAHSYTQAATQPPAQYMLPPQQAAPPASQQVTAPSPAPINCVQFSIGGGGTDDSTTDELPGIDDLPPPPLPEELEMHMSEIGQNVDLDSSGESIGEQVNGMAGAVIEQHYAVPGVESHYATPAGEQHYTSLSGEERHGKPVRRKGSVVESHANIIQKLTAQFSGTPASNTSQTAPPPQALVLGRPPPAPSKGGPSIYSNRNSIDSQSSDDVTPTAESPQDSLMFQIQRGVHLRKSVSNDRSSPKFK